MVEEKEKDPGVGQGWAGLLILSSPFSPTPKTL